jgi:hypothetical protein
MTPTCWESISCIMNIHNMGSFFNMFVGSQNGMPPYIFTWWQGVTHYFPCSWPCQKKKEQHLVLELLYNYCKHIMWSSIGV